MGKAKALAHSCLCVGLAQLAAILALFVAGQPAAETWRGTLERGERLNVDPDSRRALREGEGRPLWDGVHLLEDGSTLIIREGIAVPTQEMLEAWQGRPAPRPESRRGPCQGLVSAVCGGRGECEHSPACLRARELLSRERAEQRLAPYEAGPRPETAASKACRAAHSDSGNFPYCSPAGSGPGGGPCAELLEHACGVGERCADVTPCRLAEQLRQMEREARAAADGPGAVDEIRDQCAEALGNPFFEPCR